MQRHIKVVASFVNRRPVAAAPAHHSCAVTEGQAWSSMLPKLFLTWHPREEGADLHLAATAM